MGIFKPRYDTGDWVLLDLERRSEKRDLLAGEILRTCVIRAGRNGRRDLFPHRYYDVCTYDVEKIDGSPNFKFAYQKNERRKGIISNVSESSLSRILPAIMEAD